MKNCKIFALILESKSPHGYNLEVQPNEKYVVVGVGFLCFQWSAYTKAENNLFAKISPNSSLAGLS